MKKLFLIFLFISYLNEIRGIDFNKSKSLKKVTTPEHLNSLNNQSFLTPSERSEKNISEANSFSDVTDEQDDSESTSKSIRQHDFSKEIDDGSKSSYFSKFLKFIPKIALDILKAFQELNLYAKAYCKESLQKCIKLHDCEDAARCISEAASHQSVTIDASNQLYNLLNLDSIFKTLGLLENSNRDAFIGKILAVDCHTGSDYITGLFKSNQFKEEDIKAKQFVCSLLENNNLITLRENNYSQLNSSKHCQNVLKDCKMEADSTFSLISYFPFYHHMLSNNQPESIPEVPKVENNYSIQKCLEYSKTSPSKCVAFASVTYACQKSCIIKRCLEKHEDCISRNTLSDESVMSQCNSLVNQLGFTNIDCPNVKPVNTNSGVEFSPYVSVSIILTLIVTSLLN